MLESLFSHAPRQDWRLAFKDHVALATEGKQAYHLPETLNPGIKPFRLSRLADQGGLGHDLREDVRTFGDNDQRAAVGQARGEVVDRLLGIGESGSP